ncbi:retrovirus-related pol polyprotein from transposon TNT 1-94 [Tanacetum coccineum]|uniref:Retrovirus-related pol polyprotein from transposon TNT 1-94 n=1 Tax=Tanacetum coccineum TaxID=301880 RepID=A0ABQ5CWA8_9ASTR
MALGLTREDDDLKIALTIAPDEDKVIDVEREDLKVIYELVMEEYKDRLPEGFDRMLWGDLMIMFNQGDTAVFWDTQQDWKLISWKLHSSSGEVLFTNAGIEARKLRKMLYGFGADFQKGVNTPGSDENSMKLYVLMYKIVKVADTKVKDYYPFFLAQIADDVDLIHEDLRSQFARECKLKVQRWTQAGKASRVKISTNSYNALKAKYDELQSEFGDQEAALTAHKLGLKKVEAQLRASHKQQISLNEKNYFSNSTVKLGLGYSIKSNAEVLSYEEEMNRGIFASIRETDPGYYDIPLYSRFKQVEYKGVPHPLSGDYTPREQEDIDDSLYEYGKYGPQPQSPSPTVSNASSISFSICPSNDSDGDLGTVSGVSSTHYSTCQSNDSVGEPGTVSDHSVNDDPVSTQKTQPKVPTPTQTVDPSCAQHVKPPRQPIRTPVTSSPIPLNNRRSLESKNPKGTYVHVNAALLILVGTSRFNIGKQHVNSGSVYVNSVTQIKSAASRVNTGKRYINSGCVHINTARVNRPMSNKPNPKPSQGYCVKTSAGPILKIIKNKNSPKVGSGYSGGSKGSISEAVNTACYTFNRVRVTKPQNKTPYELLFGHKPIISYIRPFGCYVTILNTLSPLGKFDGKSDEGFLVGYSVNSKAFRVYNLATKRVEVNLHVNFLEEKPNVQGLGHRWMFDLDYLTDSMNYIPVSLQNQANPAGSKEVIDIDVQTEEAEELLVVSSSARKQLILNIIVDALAVEALGPVHTSVPYQYLILEGIFEQASYDDDGVITDFNNLPDEVDVITNPTLRIHNVHPQSQILGDPIHLFQTRASSQENYEAPC